MAAHGSQKLFGSWDGPGVPRCARLASEHALPRWLGADGWTRRRRVRRWDALALGLFTPFAALALVVVMFDAIATAHWKNGFWSAKGGYEYNLLILGRLGRARGDRAGALLARPRVRLGDNLSGVWWGVGALAVGALISLIDAHDRYVRRSRSRGRRAATACVDESSGGREPPRQFEVSLDELRRRRSAKWTMYPPTCCRRWSPRWTSRSRRRSREALARGGRARRHRLPLPAQLPEAFAASPRRGSAGQVDPARVRLVADVMTGVAELLRRAHRARRRRRRQPAGLPAVLQRHARARPARRRGAARTARGCELDLDALERAFAGGARAYLLCHPHNPTGRSLRARRARGGRGARRALRRGRASPTRSTRR